MWENLWISEASLRKLEKIQHSLALPNIKFNWTVFFWSQLYWLFIYALKNIFSYKKILIDTHTKIWAEITDIVIFRKKLLKFLHGVLTVIALSAVQSSTPTLIHNDWHNKADSLIEKPCLMIVPSNDYAKLHTMVTLHASQLPMKINLKYSEFLFSIPLAKFKLFG